MRTWAIATLTGLQLNDFVERRTAGQRIRTVGILDEEQLASLVTLRGIDKLLSSQALLPPLVRVIGGGQRLPIEAYTTRVYTEPDTIRYVDTTKLFRCFRDGGTIVLRDMHRYVPALTGLSWDLSNELGYAVTVNGYLTPYGTQGLRPHFDHHDVLVIQVAGEKEWFSYAKDAVLPLQNNTWRTVRDSVDVTLLGEDPQPMGSDKLGPGDTLFVPRGSSHAARTHGSMSFHLTLGLQDRAHYDVAATFLRHAAAATGVRRSVDQTPTTRVDSQVVKETIAALVEIAQTVGEDGLTWSLRKESHSELLETPVPLTAQYSNLVGFDPSLVLARRSQLLYQLAAEGDRAVLRIRDLSLRFPVTAMPYLRKVLAGRRISAEEPDDTLPLEARHKLLQKLLTEGVVTAVDNLSADTSPTGKAQS